MQRRLLLTAAAAGITGTVLSDAAIADAIGAALDPDIDTWDARLDTLARDNMRYGSTLMRPHLQTALTELLATPHTGTLTGHAAKLLMLYARTEPSPANASAWYGRATDTADATTDPTTIVWTYGRAALAAGGEPETAHLTPAFAERAISIGHTGDPLADIGVYLAHAALMRGWANLGDDDRALAEGDHAMRAYDRIDPDADGSEYTYAAWRHALTMSYALSLIGHADAEHWSEEAYQLGAHGRFVTHLRLHEAIRHWRDGDPTAPDAARAAMADADGDHTTLILRTMAVQAGAHELQP